MAAAPSQGDISGTGDPENPTALDREQLDEVDAADARLLQQDSDGPTAGAL
jgi:hypothetical protein